MDPENVGGNRPFDVGGGLPHQKNAHQVAEYFQAHLGLIVAAFNTLIEWFGLMPEKTASFLSPLPNLIHDLKTSTKG